MIQASQSLRQPGRDLQRYITYQFVSGMNKMAGPLYIHLDQLHDESCPWEGRDLKQGDLMQQRPTLKELTAESFLITFFSTAGLQFFLGGRCGQHNFKSTPFLLKRAVSSIPKSLSPLLYFLLLLLFSIFSNYTSVLA